MFCKQCGNELPENVKFCPNCGVEVKNIEPDPEAEPSAASAPDAQPSGNSDTKTMPSASPARTQAGKWSVLAIVSFAVAAAGVAGYLAGGVVLHIATLVMSIIALNRFKKDPTMKGKGFAIAGTVISAVSVGFFALGIVGTVLSTILGVGSSVLLGITSIFANGIFGIIYGIIVEFFKAAFESEMGFIFYAIALL